MKRGKTRALLASLGAIAIVAGACTTGGGTTAAKEVTVIGTWGGDEQTAFLEMVKPWETQTGNTVKYTGTRDLNAVLTTGVASGVLPDLAGLPGPGQMAEFARKGALKPLDDVLDAATYKADTAPALVELGTVDGKLSGVFIKAAVKGVIWYNPTVYTAGPPANFEALMGTSPDPADSLWCTGVESGAASGWPGTDWIEDIVLRQAGEEVYNQWWQGTVKWSSPEIKAAFETFGEVAANSFGGANTVLTTNFEQGGDGLFADPPQCLFHHQASFITGLGGFKDKAAGTDYDFFPFPDIDPANAGAVEGAGDLFGMFKDTEPAKSLMKYLVTAEAQDIWVKKGGALSANKKAVSYPDDIAKRSAEILTGAQIFVFDASDLMPTAMNSAFWKAILDYVQTPANLDTILADLDKVQADAYAAS